MRTLFQVTLTMLVAFGFVSQAKAGLLLEPSAGIANADVSYTYTGIYALAAPNDYKNTMTGAVAFGARVGYSFMVPFIALDYQMVSGKGKVDPDYDPTAEKNKVNQTAIYVVLGADFPFGLRTWVGYGFSDTLKLKDSSAETTLTGKSLKLGIGYKVMPHLSFNFEYFASDYTDLKNPALGKVKVSDIYSKLAATGYILSVSVPFDIL